MAFIGSYSRKLEAGVYGLKRFVSAAAISLLTVLSQSPATAAELVMFESPGCEYCELWDSEIGSFYAETSEGKALPLRRVRIHDEWPKDLTFIRLIQFTPTFVVVDRGREIGRITGYPGEDFFWGYLGEIRKKLKPAKAQPKKRPGQQQH
jgi:hypothetical protein